MASYKMKLTSEEKDILDGKKGETLRKAMQTVVMYGETFGAKRLVPVKPNIHMVMSFGIPLAKPVFRMMDELINSGIKKVIYDEEYRDTTGINTLRQAGIEVIRWKNAQDVNSAM